MSAKLSVIREAFRMAHIEAAASDMAPAPSGRN